MEAGGVGGFVGAGVGFSWQGIQKARLPLRILHGVIFRQRLQKIESSTVFCV